MLRQEIRRVMLSPFWYISIIILTIGSFFPVIDELSLSNDVVYFFDTTGLGYGGALTPILSCLAVADSYLIEFQSGYHYTVMSRTTKLKYCLSKMGVAIASSICMVLIWKLLLLVSLMIIVKSIHGSFVFGGDATVISIGIASYWVSRGKFGIFVGQIILYDCMYAAVFPGLSLVISTITKNRYIVMLFPFIYANVTAFVFVGLKWYYLTPTVLDSEGRATLLPHEGLPYRIMVVLIYWIVSTILFTRGVWKQTK